MWSAWCLQHQSCRHRQLASESLDALTPRIAWRVKYNRFAVTGIASAPDYTAIKHRIGTRAWDSLRPFGIAVAALVVREVTTRRIMIGAGLGGESARGFTVERPETGMLAWVSRARGAIADNNKCPGAAKAENVAALRPSTTAC